MKLKEKDTYLFIITAFSDGLFKSLIKQGMDKDEQSKTELF